MSVHSQYILIKYAFKEANFGPSVHHIVDICTDMYNIRYPQKIGVKYYESSKEGDSFLSADRIRALWKPEFQLGLEIWAGQGHIREIRTGHFFLKFIYFERERQRVGRNRERGGKNPNQALGCQCRARCRVQTHEL